jgi:23S rRNA (adenine-N6)-dimethyltransferase
VAADVRAAGALRWGWHPLRADWASQLVAGSPVRRGDVVVDLGAGDGALSRPLADIGARVLAVELLPQRAAALRVAFAGTRVAVLEMDLRDFRWPGHPFRVVANPPYVGVNDLVRSMLGSRHLVSADLVLAEGAARGLVRRVGGRRLELGERVPRSAFLHPPPVPARVLRVRG